MRGNSVAILMIICGARSATAGVYCTAPEVPTFYGTKPTRPTIPFCLNEFNNTNSCDEFVIENYNAAVDIYNREISEYNSEADLYIDELNRYVRDAQAYTRCEASNL
jgi:hypothetical protein